MNPGNGHTLASGPGGARRPRSGRPRSPRAAAETAALEWTDALVGTLIWAWRAGESAATIAVRIGGTPAAVLDKIHRLGLDGAAPPKPAPRIKATSGPAPAAPAKGKPAEATMPPAAPAPAEGVAFADLRRHHCRWPVDGIAPDAELRYCGASVGGVGPYCAAHAARAYGAAQRAAEAAERPRKGARR